MKYTYAQIVQAFKEVHEGEDHSDKDILDSLTWFCSYRTAEELTEESTKGLALYLDGSSGIPGYKTPNDVEGYFEEQYEEFEDEQEIEDNGIHTMKENLKDFFKPEEDEIEDPDEEEEDDED